VGFNLIPSLVHRALTGHIIWHLHPFMVDLYGPAFTAAAEEPI